MSRNNKKASKSCVWRRRIISGHEELWQDRLRAVGCKSWALVERPGRPRALLEAYVDSRSVILTQLQKWGGQVHTLDAKKWVNARPAPPTRIGRRLEIIHQKERSRKPSTISSLYIPHGLAFGSGEHATTAMLLGAMTRMTDWNGLTVLDLGTGSGVLALAARLFGAHKVLAMDFDTDAVRTARQNETLNFSTSLIQWRMADVRKLRDSVRYDLVLANLFSGILIEVAQQIAGCVSLGGHLWLSGILRSQQEEVVAAYRDRNGLQLQRAVLRGKWVLLQWSRPHHTGGEKKVTQTK